MAGRCRSRTSCASRHLHILVQWPLSHILCFAAPAHPCAMAALAHPWRSNEGHDAGLGPRGILWLAGDRVHRASLIAFEVPDRIIHIYSGETGIKVWRPLMRQKPGHPQTDTNDFLDRPCFAVGYFSIDECAQIRRLSASISSSDGKVTDEKVDMHDVRHSTVRWLTPSDDSRWVFEKLWLAIEEVNQRYQFDLFGIREVQIARYGAGDFYDWHLEEVVRVCLRVPH